jgi:hypothetical protein
MVDVFKCRNCGEIVERPRNCPSCGESAMQPTQVPESELDGSEDEPTADEGRADDSGTDGDGTARRDQSEPSGLLGWLKSLF